MSWRAGRWPWRRAVTAARTRRSGTSRGVGPPALGRAKRRLGARLGSAATAGEGTQNYLCAAQAAAVLAGLALTAAWPGGWWLDPVIGLGIAAVAVREGTRSWHGDGCC